MKFRNFALMVLDDMENRDHPIYKDILITLNGEEVNPIDVDYHKLNDDDLHSYYFQMVGGRSAAWTQFVKKHRR